MRSRAFLSLLLVFMGAAWGLTQPLSKISVSTGYQPWGLIFWELVFVTLLLGGWLKARRQKLGLSRQSLPIYLFIAFAGTLFPNYMTFSAYVHLPAGIMALIIACVPMFSVPVAIAMGLERPQVLRMLGILAGASAVALLVGPEGSLPEGARVVYVLLGCLAPLSYAIEGNVVARFGTGDLTAPQALFGASLAGAVISLPLMLASGSWINAFAPWDLALWALLGSSLLHGVAYSIYIWMVGAAGSVYTAQVSYLVTASGICWSMLLLGERYSGWVWAAFALMMAGIALVKPKPPAPALGLDPGGAARL